MRMKEKMSRNLFMMLVVFCCTSTPDLYSQSDTLFFFDFEDLEVELKGDQVISSIKNNHGEFQDAVPRYPNRTVAYGDEHSFRNANPGNYPVGRLFLYHSPSWAAQDQKGKTFNHVELTLDTTLAADTYYRISFLVANMKSHRYKPAHYGVKFAASKVIKEGKGSLLSEPDIFFDFTDDDSFVEIQAIMSFEEPIQFMYFGMFKEDTARISKKFIPVSDKISYSDTAAYWKYVKHTRVMLDNILIERLNTMAESFRDIYFPLDEDRVTSQKDNAFLKNIAKEMKAHPETYLLIQGYSDSSGTYLYNLDLSARRAGHVKEILIDHGIAGHRLVTFGKGVFPAIGDGSDAGYARKVSFLLLSS